VRYLMKCIRRYTGIMALSAVSMAASAACPTGWTTVNAGNIAGSLAFKVAVASNFVPATQTLANSYLGGSPTSYIQICGTSSGTISPEIVSNNSTHQFSIFLSADEGNVDVVAAASPVITRGLKFKYANGIPVFLLSPNATSAYPLNPYPAAYYLNQGLVSGADAVGTVSSISNQVNIKRDPDTPSVDYLAIGEPSLAPYGVAGISILTAAGQWDPLFDTYIYANNDVANPCSDYVDEAAGEWVCSYRNIDFTLQAVDNNRVTAGIVSNGQVCPQLNGLAYDDKRYVLFPAYPTEQYGISLDIASSTEEANSDAFLSYLNIANPSSTGGLGVSWNSWLDSNCYDSI
jgi:ABC-type molybdate transport system substrate-binding protein